MMYGMQVRTCSWHKYKYSALTLRTSSTQQVAKYQVDLFALQCGGGGTQIGELVLEQEKGT